MPVEQPPSKHFSEQLGMQGSLANFPLLNGIRAKRRNVKVIRNCSHKERSEVEG
jgi:hypothetical protein